MPTPATHRVSTLRVTGLLALVGLGWAAAPIDPALTLVAWVITGAAVLAAGPCMSLARTGALALGAVACAGLFSVVIITTTGSSTAQPAAAADGALLSMLNTTWALALCLVAGAVIRVLWRQRAHRRRGWQLAEALAAERAATLRAALAEERSAMAGEIHDGIGHRLAHTTLGLGRLSTDPSLPPEVRNTVDRLRNDLADVTGDLGDAVQLLRSGGSSVAPVDRGLSDVVADLRTRGATLEVTGVDAADPISPHARAALARVLHEACANAAKHADGAPVSARLRRIDERIELTVLSSVTSVPRPDRGGTGLDALARRLDLLGGRLDHSPTDGTAGDTFVVRAVVDAEAEPRRLRTGIPDVAEERLGSTSRTRRGLRSATTQALALALIGVLVAVVLMVAR